MKYCVLSSGSAGNCIWLRGGGVEVLVDCGLSARRIEGRLRDVGQRIEDVQAVVCSHGHGDHVRGAAVLARRHGMEIHGTEETLSLIRDDPPRERLNAIPRGGRFSIGGLRFQSVPTMHDSPGSSAFVIEDAEVRFGVVTDLGVHTESLVRSFRALDALILEMNHDEGMLWEGPYPGFLKKRISSDLGHLSNRQGADLLARLAHTGLGHLTLAHLSEENNTPARALDAARGVLAAAGLEPLVAVAGPYQACEPVSLEGRGQLALGHW